MIHFSLIIGFLLGLCAGYAAWVHRRSENDEDRTLGAARSGRWPGVRDSFLKGKVCAVCGRKEYLVAHHMLPFHMFPQYELDPKNLIALCERPSVLNCHLVIGHLGSFRKYNPSVDKDAEEWRAKLS